MSRRWPPPTYDLSHEEGRTEEITMTLIFFASSGLPHERSFTIKCIIEGKHIEVPTCLTTGFLTKSVYLKPRLVLANLRNLQNDRRQIK